jgi:chaperonin GroES
MIRPMQNRIVVRELTTEKATLSGIILAGNAADKPIQGEVLAVGPGIYNDKNILEVPAVNLGDRILFIQGTGELIKVNDQEYRILQETDIIAIIK